jgi:hypothetical protein
VSTAKVHELIGHLRNNFGTPKEERFLALIGASGSGKFSHLPSQFPPYSAANCQRARSGLWSDGGRQLPPHFRFPALPCPVCLTARPTCPAIWRSRKYVSPQKTEHFLIHVTNCERADYLNRGDLSKRTHIFFNAQGRPAHGVDNASRSSVSTRLQMRSDPSPITAFFLNA